MRTLKRTYLPADDWPTLRDALARGDLEINFIVCRIALRALDERELIIEDIMEPLVQELCLHAVVRLLRGEDYEFRNWDYPGTMRLRHENHDGHESERICIDSDEIGTACFVKHSLIEALLDCARQTMALMRQLHAFAPNYLFAAYPYFTEQLAEATRLYEAAYGQA